MRRVNLLSVAFTAALFTLGCPPDDDPPVADTGNIQTTDTSQPDPDMERPRDMGRDVPRPRPDAGPDSGADTGTPDMDQPDMRTRPEVPSAEPSDPAASATAMVDDPATATTVTISAENLGDEMRTLRLGVLTYTGGRRQSTEEAPTRVPAGETATAEFDLRTIGIATSTLTLPARVIPRVIVGDGTGSVIERVYGEAIEVGPSLEDGFAALLTAHNLQATDIPTDGFGNFQTVLAAADETDTGLEDAELLGPGEDEGPTLPTPNYADGVPDQNGLYHYVICLRWPVTWSDAGFGEDYGVQPEGTWRARGSRVQIKANDELIFDDWLNEDGCTGMIDTEHKTNFWIVGYSVAMVNGNTVVVRDFDGEIDAYVRTVPFVGGSGTKHYTLPQTNRSNLLAATTFTLARWPQLSGETFEINDRCEPDFDQCCDCSNPRGIWIDRRTRKFLISHEVGHSLLSFYTGGYVNDCSKVISGNNLPCVQSNPDSHALTSNEWSSCAAMEGWAHFVGVRAYNDHLEGDNPGATFQYWGGSGTTVDVEQGPTGGVDKYYETVCGGVGATADGSGVELDWLRHWWDYHTNPSPAGPVSQGTMMQEIAEDSNWMSQNVYQTISDGIEAFSGTSQRDRWEEIARGNGVDH